MIRVLFVCLGNICRSPMAEAILRQKAAERGLSDQVHIESAGTGHWHVGQPPHEGTINILADNEIDASGLSARQVVEEDLDSFDIVVALDAENLGFLQTLRKQGQEVEVVRLLDYSDREESDVPDPYFTGNFQEVYDMVDEACASLLEEVENEWL
ncbi:low molecular weight phosphotyrosine protein phosphatase [Salicibibacter halophilus]|uniref:protein-tyrosine-phosphatase n=1 Tax=Salicibibacter halophilus TaxID=2502791 RepID=A0A514LDG1_9BACI|nr:low molecular weight protein-tyrosine-phosphatase [Salicibibacter halophilus]QDI89886.1 low molecular weight phosphotyrosine protein phosphatase [Salicibibacter halophilus]